MSLISEALKKAQKMRANPMAGAAAPGDGGHVARRGRPMPAKTLALIVAGVAFLMIAAVVITTIIVRRPTPPPATAAKPEPTPPPASIAASSAPEPVAATEPPPAPHPSSRPPESIRPASLPSPKSPSASAAAKMASLPEAKSPVTPATALPRAPARHDPRVQAFIDAVHVTGIRSSGTDSKVLMNDRVFRLDDIVDRSLGIRLTEVRTDSLTFVDEQGFTYTKNF